jgi:hypothetical protein
MLNFYTVSHALDRGIMSFSRLSDALFAAFTVRAGGAMVQVYSHLRLGPYAEVFSPSQVSQRAKDLMQHASRQTVLVDDADTTLAFESWPVWSAEHRGLRLLEDLIPEGAVGVEAMQGVVADWSPWGTFVEDAGAIFYSDHPPAADFAATDVHRRSRNVLDQARERPVFIDYKQTLLTVDRWSQRQFEHSVLDILQDVLQFQAAHRARRGLRGSAWACGTPYPWVAALPDDEIDEFAAELLPYLLESVRQGQLEGYFGNLEGWRTAALVHGNRTLQNVLAEWSSGRSAGVQASHPTQAAARRRR